MIELKELIPFSLIDDDLWGGLEKMLSNEISFVADRAHIARFTWVIIKPPTMNLKAALIRQLWQQ